MSDPSRPPVVLVHGYLSPAVALTGMRWGLQRRGRVAHLVSLPVLAVADVRLQARDLDRSIEAIRASTGADRVDLVGVSLGGITALWWLRKLGGYTRARRMVAVGTPFRGTAVAHLGAGLLGWAGRGASQCVPGSPLLRELEGGSPIPSTSIAARGDRVAPPESCHLEGAENLVLQGPRFGWVAHQWLVMHGRTLDVVARELD